MTTTDEAKHKYADISNAYVFQIDDVELTFLTDPGTKKIYPTTSWDAPNPPHLHLYFELFFVSQGSFSVFFPDSEIVLSQGDIIVIPPQILHTTGNRGGDIRRYGLNFYIRQKGTQSSTSLFCSLSSLLKAPFYLQRGLGSLTDTVSQIYTCALRQDRLRLGLHLHELIVKLLAAAPGVPGSEADCCSPDSDIKRLHHISTLLNAGYRRNMTLNDLANSLNLSTRQTNRIIQRHFGMPFHALMLAKRMDYASNLVAHSELSIAEIAQRSGYTSTKGFSYSFQKKYGCLPSDYRKLHRT